jgi:hypothetical protein
MTQDEFEAVHVQMDLLEDDIEIYLGNACFRIQTWVDKNLPR